MKIKPVIVRYNNHMYRPHIYECIEVGHIEHEDEDSITVAHHYAGGIKITPELWNGSMIISKDHIIEIERFPETEIGFDKQWKVIVKETNR